MIKFCVLLNFIITGKYHLELMHLSLLERCPDFRACLFIISLYHILPVKYHDCYNFHVIKVVVTSCWDLSKMTCEVLISFLMFHYAVTF